MSETKNHFMLLLAIVSCGGLLGGCQTTQEALAADDGAAIQAALKRGRWELECPAATGTVLSSTMLQPVLWGGIERAEYQVGVAGCGKRATYIVICPQDSSGCLATGNRDSLTGSN